MGRKLSHHAMERDKMIVAGFGMRADVTEASLQDALGQTGYAPDAIATVADKAEFAAFQAFARTRNCLLYTSPSPRDGLLSRMPSSA